MNPATSVEHGGIGAREAAELGLDVRDVLDLSANLHPLGPHPSVVRAAREADLTRYPEPHAETMREAIARLRGLEPGQVWVTAGATAAIHLAARAFAPAGAGCAVFAPTFGEYAAAIRAGGGRVVEYRAKPPAFEISERACAPGPLGFLCNPNNPTGRYLDRAAVERIADRLRGVLVLDAAYEPFVEGGWDADELVRDGRPVVVVHSFTKLHAVPGLRVGYVTAPPALIERIARLQPSWSVGAAEIAAGLAALEAEAAQRAALAGLPGTRDALREALHRLGAVTVDGRANFVLAQVGDAPGVRRRLLAQGFAVRDCTSFGLPDWIRVAVPPPDALGGLVAALERVLGGDPGSGRADG